MRKRADSAPPECVTPPCDAARAAVREDTKDEGQRRWLGRISSGPSLLYGKTRIAVETEQKVSMLQQLCI